MLTVRRRTLYICLTILGLFLLGTVIVLSSVSYYLSINTAAYLSELEVPILDNVTRWNASEHGQVERIPRILHQTWKSETLPARWKGISQACRDMMPDYEYMLWTDASSREFIAEHYPWFLDTFDDYTYPIQRADVIRYFVLYHYGGVYLDLDIGCIRPLDPLLIHPVILPKTIPVGVSNDLIFAEKGHPFLAQTIHNLVTFDHSWLLNYPTVMFSTGPMFLSAQYGLYTSSHPSTPEQPGGEVRILPKSLYGKNAGPEEAPHSFFSHFYGSSWHADDAAFIGFLGKRGKVLMWIGLAILVLGLVRLVLSGNRRRKYSLRRIGGYDVLLPRWSQRNGHWNLDLGWLSLPGTQPSSPIISGTETPGDEDVSLLPMSFEDDIPASPTTSEFSTTESFMPAHVQSPQSVFGTLKSAGSRALAILTRQEVPGPRRGHSRGRRRRNRGVLFFLPAFLSPSQQDIELGSQSLSTPTPMYPSTPHLPQLPPEKRHTYFDVFDDNTPVEPSYDHSRTSHSTSWTSSTLVDVSDIPQPGSSRDSA